MAEVEHTTDAGGQRQNGTRPRWHIWVGAAVAVVLVAVLVALYFALGQDDDSGTPGGTPGTSSAPTSSPSPSGDADGEEVVPPLTEGATEVPVGEEVEVAPGLSASVVDVTSFQAEGRGAGEVSGPALRFVLVLGNESQEAVALDGATVNLYYGDDTTPASPLLNDPEAAPLAGTLEAGAIARGTYAFSVPEEQHDSFRLEFSHAAGSERVLFHR